MENPAMPDPTPIVTRMFAQGDVLFVRVTTPIPSGLTEAVRGPDGFVVAHSETGHHHVVRDPTARLFLSSDRMVDFLEVTSGGAAVEHLRNYDTHETRVLATGTWQIRRQREMDSATTRMVAD